jgi:hypothetical protein
VEFILKKVINHEIPCKVEIYSTILVTTSRKVAGSRPDEVNERFSIYLILPAALGPGVYSTFNRSEYQKQKNVSGK